MSVSSSSGVMAYGTPGSDGWLSSCGQWYQRAMALIWSDFDGVFEHEAAGQGWLLGEEG